MASGAAYLDGHELLDAARDKGRWQKVKESVAGLGGIPFEVVRAALLGMARQEASERLTLAE